MMKGKGVSIRWAKGGAQVQEELRRVAPRRRAGGLRKARRHASELEAEHIGWGGLARTGGDEAEAAGGDLWHGRVRVSGVGS